jgi:hypothetical protein
MEVDTGRDAAPGLNTARCVWWQAMWIAFACGAALALGRGSLWSVLAGGAVLLASFVLQRLAVRAALREERRPTTAIGFFLLKLLLLLGVVAAGMKTSLVSPMSFAVGATTLPLAIVTEACYSALARSRSA